MICRYLFIRYWIRWCEEMHVITMKPSLSLASVNLVVALNGDCSSLDNVGVHSTFAVASSTAAEASISSSL